MKTKISLIRLIPVICAVLGAAAGWAYYYFVGCASGTCPIVSSPVLMPLYAALMGYLLGTVIRPSGKKPDNDADR